MFIEDFLITGTLTPDQIVNLDTNPVKMIDGLRDKIIAVEAFYSSLDFKGKPYVLNTQMHGGAFYAISTLKRPELCVFGDLDLGLIYMPYDGFNYLRRKKPYPYGCFENWVENFLEQDLYLNLTSYGVKAVDGNSPLNYRMECKAIDPRLIFEV